MPEPLRDIFIKNLKFYRKQKNLSQEKLSYAIDMSMNYINQLENKNSFPPPEVIDKMASVLEIRPAQLFDENASPQNIASTDRERFIADIVKQLHEAVKEDLSNGVTAALGKIFK